MLKTPYRLVFATTFVGLTLCSHQALAQNVEPPPGALATVNGRPITQLAVDSIAKQISETDQVADTQNILEELINLEVLTQAAEELDLDKQAEVASALQLQYIQTMANAYLAHKSSRITITDDKLWEEYAAQSISVERAEYKASHILLETASEAESVLRELSTGKVFAEAAAEHSIDPGGESGGDLGWFVGSNMVPEFATALDTMQVGDVSEEPVETEFGFHIINLVDKRETALPDFDSVKSGLRNLVARKELAEHLEELKAAAEINRQ